MHAKIYELMAQAQAAGNTPAGVALAEEAVREADAAEDAALAYEARQQLIRLGVFSGAYDRALVAFSWCLAKADEMPDEFSVAELLWTYKWVIEHLTHFPRISRAQIMASLEDFRVRCLRAGFNERSALFLRWVSELWMGDRAAAERTLEQWKLTRTDGMSDCPACELNRVVEFHATLGQHARAIQKAAPILQGRRRCAEVPHITHAVLLASFWRTGQPKLAEEQHGKGYRLVRNNRDFLREHAWHLAHLLRSHQLEPAAALVRKHLPWALETRSLDYRFFFLLPARLCVDRLVQQGVATLRCRLPLDVCPVAGKTVVPLKELSAWMAKVIPELAAQFDARNGNSHFTGLAAALAGELE